MREQMTVSSSGDDVVKTARSPALRNAGSAQAAGQRRAAVLAVDEHQRFKNSEVNAGYLDAAVRQLNAGKGVKWNPFTAV